MINIFIAVGNLVREVELRESGEMKYVHNSLAVQRDFTNRGTGKIDCDFVPFKAFGKTAEYLAKYAKKGTKLCIKGRLVSESYITKQGEKKSSLCINCEDVNLLNRKEVGADEDEEIVSNENKALLDGFDDDDTPF